MKRIDTVLGHVLITADAGVAHDSDAAARLICGRGLSITPAAIAHRAVKRMICPELMAHFVGHIIDSKSIAERRSETGYALCLKR